MIEVVKIWPEIKKIAGTCHEDVIFRRLTDSVELLANKGDWDPLIGYVDICADGEFVTLPREIETVITLNLGGSPALGLDSLFTFHLNGPGDNCRIPCDSWQDLGDAITFREIRCPVQLVASPVLEEDEDTELWVYGFDENNHWIRTKVGETWVDGWLVPVKFSVMSPGEDAPLFSRITRIRKEVSSGPIRLSTIDSSSGTGVLIGVFAHDETNPVYRRIRLGRKVDWVRVCFRRRTFEIKSVFDLIPLHNPQAVIMMFRALKHYAELDFAIATNCEATAVRWLEEEQLTRTPPVQSPIQFRGPLVGDDAWQM